MWGERRALGDPPAEGVFLRRGECLLLLGWRHRFFFVGGEDPGDEFAVGGFSLNDCGDAGLTAFERAFAGVETKSGLAVLGIGAVTVEAVLGQNRLNLACEIDGGRGGCACGRW